MQDKPHYFFIDESGIPSLESKDEQPIYIMAGLFLSKETLEALRVHLAAFRYYGNISKEFKDWGGMTKNPPPHQLRTFVDVLRTLAHEGELAVTVTWLDKDDYKGPYLTATADSADFRAFQVRRLLERHKDRGLWSDNLDIVLDRWNMSEGRLLNLRHYVREKIGLDPKPVHVTVADSMYVDALQAVDMCARIAKRVVEGEANEWYAEVAEDLMAIYKEDGLYA